MKSLCFRKLEFPKFPSFRFWSLYEIENLKNSEIFSPPVNSKECVFLYEVGNFRGFRVFDFGFYTEIESLENSEIFSQHLQIPKNVVYLRKFEISEVSEFSILALILYSKTRKTRKYFQVL